MGLNATTLVPGNTKDEEALAAQYQLINYMSTHMFVRRLVSQKRRRMLVNGYDLDMSYITDRILAMSFPAERMRAIYRNPMWQVKEVLELKHRDHYKVYNLCIEQDYDPSHFNGFVERFPFDDNHVPPLPLIKEFCEDVHSWLSKDPKHIVVIHCMAGKGRTGLMVSSYLVYSGLLAEEALQVYADKRTTNNLGVTIPSQRRYVNYWQKSLTFPVAGQPPEVNIPEPTTREFRQIRLYDTKGIDTVFFVVSKMEEVSGERYRPSTEICRKMCRKIKTSVSGNSLPFSYPFIEEEDDSPTSLECNFTKSKQVTGDVCVTFYEKNIGGRLFYACFNTAFIEDNSIKLSITELDKVGSKAKAIAGPEFRVELLFGPAESNSDNSLSAPANGGDQSDGGDGGEGCNSEL